MSSKINNTFSSYMLAFLMPSRALRHANVSRLTQKGLETHSLSKLDTHAAIARTCGVPSLTPLSWRRLCVVGWILASAALAGICMYAMCTSWCLP